MTTVSLTINQLLDSQTHLKPGLSAAVYAKDVNLDDGSQKITLPLSGIPGSGLISIWRITGYYQNIATIATDLWSDAGSEESFDAHIEDGYGGWRSPKAFGKLSHLRQLGAITFEMENPWPGLNFTRDLSLIEIDFPELDIDATPTLDVVLNMWYTNT